MYNEVYRTFLVVDFFFYFRGFCILLAIVALYRSVKDPALKKMKRARGLALVLVVSSIFDLFMFERRELLKWSVELPTIILGILLYIKAVQVDSSAKLTSIKLHLSSVTTGSFLTLVFFWFFLFPAFWGDFHIDRPFLKTPLQPALISTLLAGERCSCELGDKGWFLFKGSVDDGVLFLYNRGILEKLALTGKTIGDDGRTQITYANEYLSLPFKCTESFEKTDGDCDAQLPEDSCNLEKVFTCDLKIKDLKTRGESKQYSGMKSKCRCQ